MRYKALLLTALVATMGLAACGSDPTPTPPPTPTATAVPAPAPTATATPTPQVMTFTSVKDNTLFQDDAGSLSSGAGNAVFLGRTSRGSLRRALLQFDVSAIPAGSTVTSAELRVYVNREKLFGEDASVHRVTGSWGEGGSIGGTHENSGGQGAPAEPGEVTWLHRGFDAVRWTTPGGDFVQTASATVFLQGRGAHSWSSEELAADVQTWLDDPSANAGWVLIGNEEADQTAKRIASREDKDPERRPMLVVEFLP